MLVLNEMIFVVGIKCLWEVCKDNQVICYFYLDCILFIWLDVYGNVWVGLQNKGLYFYVKGDLSMKFVILFLEFFVIGVLFDRNGGFWCMMFE